MHQTCTGINFCHFCEVQYVDNIKALKNFSQNNLQVHCGSFPSHQLYLYNISLKTKDVPIPSHSVLTVLKNSYFLHPTILLSKWGLSCHHPHIVATVMANCKDQDRMCISLKGVHDINQLYSIFWRSCSPPFFRRPVPH